MNHFTSPWITFTMWFNGKHKGKVFWRDANQGSICQGKWIISSTFVTQKRKKEKHLLWLPVELLPQICSEVMQMSTHNILGFW